MDFILGATNNEMSRKVIDYFPTLVPLGAGELTHLSSFQRYDLKALGTTISYKHTVDPPWAWDTERARTLQRYKQTTKRNMVAQELVKA